MAGIIFSILISLLPILAYAGPPPDVIEKAKTEGEVVWWGGSTEAQDREFIRRFNQKYPFIKVEQWNTSSNATQERVWAEFTAKKFSWDVVTGGTRAAQDWIKAGVMQKWTVPGLSRLPAEARDPDSYYAAFGFNVSIPAYNTKLISAEDAPKSWKDLLDPKWKGKIAAPDVMDMWVVFAQPNVWGKPKTLEYVTLLAANQPKLLSWTPALTLVSAGDLYITVEALLFRAIANKAKGAPIELVKANPLAGRGPKTFLSVKPAHPNAALVWLDWVYSSDGEKAVDEVLDKGSPFPGSNSRQAQIIKGVRFAYEDDAFYKSSKPFQKELKSKFGIK